MPGHAWSDWVSRWVGTGHLSRNAVQRNVLWMRLGCGMGNTHSRAMIGTAFAISERMLAPLLTPPWLRASRLASRALFRLAAGQA